ncbi:MAG: response regulator [Pseudomonadales bacterium]|nr:response regulator [Pseudomonadales bacterium]
MIKAFDRYLYKLPIKQKLLVIMLSSIWIAMSLAVTSVILYDRHSFRINFIDEMRVISNIISQRSAAALAFSDRKAADSNLETLHLHQSIHLACLYNKNNYVLSYYQSEKSVALYCPDAIEKEPENTFDDEYLNLSTDVYRNGNKLGTLFIKASLAHISKRVWNFTMAALVFQIAAGWMAYFLTLRLQRTITNPIIALSEIAQDIKTSKNYLHRALKTSDDETGVLVDAFNDMLHMIQLSDLQMKELVSELNEKKLISEGDALSEKQRSIAVKEFFAGASHDLRQPLHAMAMFLDAMKMESDEEKKQQLLLKLEASVKNMSDLFNELLDVSKLEARINKPNLKDVAIKSMLQRISLEFEVLAADKKLQFRCRPLDIVVRSDPIMLERLIRNLVSNAIRYTEKGGVLLVCRKKQQGLFIEVWDTGIGIPEDKVELIFEQYTQLDNPAHQSKKGFGLGLSIVKRLSHLLDYPISLRSVYGRGTVMRFQIQAPEKSALGLMKDKPGLGNKGRLPPRETNGSSASAKQALRVLANKPINTPITSMVIPAGADNNAVISNPLAGKRILIIDDDTTVLDALSSLLSTWGISCYAAESGSQAMAALADEGFKADLILSDFRLAHSETGVHVVQQLRQQFDVSIPAIIITGESDAEHLQMIKTAGLRLLHKPVKAAKLRALISYYLK